MSKHLKGYVVWEGKGDNRKPLFIPSENGKYRLVYSANGSLILSDWDLLHKKDSMSLDIDKDAPLLGIPKSTSIQSEVKLRALGMVFNVSNKYRLQNKTAIDFCIEKIDFMIQYNPISTNPTKEKKEYHNFWEHVKSELLAMRELT